MKKYFKYYAICWAIGLIAFNVITFVVMDATYGLAALTKSFWIGYGFITLMFVGNLLCSLLFFKEENKDRVFLKISVMHYAYYALIASLVAGVIAMVTPSIPYWVGVVVDVLILAFYSIAIIKSVAAAEIISAVDEKVAQKTVFIKMLTVDADALQSRAKTTETKKLATQVYEAIRYSDPMSTSELNGINSQIQCEFELFTNAIYDGNDELAKSTADEIFNLIESRNKKCRALK